MLDHSYYRLPLYGSRFIRKVLDVGDDEVRGIEEREECPQETKS